MINVIICICLLTDATFHPEVDAHVSERVTLTCVSPADDPISVTWRYQSSRESNESSVLLRMEEGVIRELNSSGRLSLNRTLRNHSDLVIYEVLQSDTGTYTCTIDVGYWKQHVTALKVTAGIYITQCYIPACITYKTVCIVQPAYLHSVLKQYTPSRRLRSSDCSLLAVPRVRTCFGSRSFAVAAPTTWNSLPLHIRNSSSIFGFRPSTQNFSL